MDAVVEDDPSTQGGHTRDESAGRGGAPDVTTLAGPTNTATGFHGF
jgi:hypothetical protein